MIISPDAYYADDADDEAWHVISGTLLFRFEQTELIVTVGSTLLVPAYQRHSLAASGGVGVASSACTAACAPPGG
jgi:mannose-6-phosphate isomerase-like protein (cupin superfamily)